jgi:hypothetical protein
MDSSDEQDWLVESAMSQPHLRHLIEGTPAHGRDEGLSIDPKRKESMESLFPYGYSPPLPILYVD